MLNKMIIFNYNNKVIYKMANFKKLQKIESIIQSCENYDQVLTCESFINFFKDDLSLQFEVLGMIQKKVYQLRNQDLEEHIQALKEINQKYNS